MEKASIFISSDVTPHSTVRSAGRWWAVPLQSFTDTLFRANKAVFRLVDVWDGAVPESQLCEGKAGLRPSVWLMLAPSGS